MNAQKIILNDKTIVLWEKNFITLEGPDSRGLADGLVRMINERQCPECGKFNGLHGEVFIKTGQDGGGGVEGFYRMCSHNREKL